ncbi:MAG TPA: FAD-dependent hydroxylase [Stenomitos sp.]
MTYFAAAGAFDMRPTTAVAPLSGSEEKAVDYDLVIVGGGIAGLTLAAALKYSKLKVAIIEAQPHSEAVAKGQAYAIHQSSRRIWDSIGVWNTIEPQIQPFRRVCMSDADFSHIVRFSPSDLRTDALGYVAEHRVLLQALMAFVRNCANVEWHVPARVIAKRDYRAYVEVDIQSLESEAAPVHTLRTRLAVGADGAMSQMRQQSQIQTRGKAYWQSCIVATVRPEKFHGYTAYERFWPSGPFAILPISDTLCRIVWTAPHAEAQALLALDDDAFVARLMERYGLQMGRLALASPRFAFPARFMHACNYVRSRLALVGDAAHTCHPVGGQGLNLGIRDVGALAHVLLAAQRKGEDIGSLKVLKRYERWRRWENMLSLGFTDLLNRLFSNQFLPLVLFRRMGFIALSLIPPLKIAVLRFMAGLSGKMPLLREL